MIEFELCGEISPAELQNHADGNWVSETKLDGRRCAVKKDGDTITIFGRDYINPNQFPEVLDELRQQEHNFIVDCEFIVLKDGKSNFGLLQSRSKTQDKFKVGILSKQIPVTIMAFDILEYDGQDVAKLPLTERKAIMSNLDETGNFKLVKCRDDVMNHWADAMLRKEEGIVLKRKDLPYVGKRTDDWLKCKIRETVVIRFDGYEVNPVGITLTNKDSIRCACNGIKHRPVKETIDSKGYVDVEIVRLGGRTEAGRHREIVFGKVV